MALEGEQRVVAAHAAAVVHDVDAPLPAGLDLAAEALSPGVERILDQLLHHRGRPLDHFSGGDLVGDGFGENADAAHGKNSDECRVTSDEWKSGDRRQESK